MITAATLRQSFLSLAPVLCAAVAVAFAGLCGCSEHSATSHPAATSGTEPAEVYEVLNGKWRRPDGGYLLHIKSVADNGKTDASYFNPNSIHVAKAEASCGNGHIKLVIELRDVNYPGSTYTLAYDPADDRLKGSYYQAVAQETYEIFFVRLKP